MAASLRLPPFTQLPLEPPGEMLFMTPWHIAAANAGEDVKHWDYHVDLSCTRTVEVNPTAIRDYCGLSPDARLAIFAEWSTDLSSYARGRSSEVEVGLDTDNSVECALRLPIRGSETGGTLTLHTQIIVTDIGSSQGGTLTTPGSILWTHEYEYILEAPGSRLPVCVVNFDDFPDKFDSPNAAWVVELIPEGLELPPSVGMEIYLNSRHQELVELVSQSDNSYGSTFASRMMYFDIGRQLVSQALADAAFCDSEYEYPEGSIGASLRIRVRTLFPELALPEISALYRENLRQFETIIQGSLLELP